MGLKPSHFETFLLKSHGICMDPSDLFDFNQPSFIWSQLINSTFAYLTENTGVAKPSPDLFFLHCRTCLIYILKEGSSRKISLQISLVFIICNNFAVFVPLFLLYEVGYLHCGRPLRHRKNTTNASV